MDNILYAKFSKYLKPTEIDDVDEFLMEESEPLVEDAPDEAWNALNEYMKDLVPYMEEQEELKKQGIVVVD